MFNKKYFLGGMLIGVVLLLSSIFSLPDGKLHIFFCDVGQGDAAYIRTPSNQDLLIDGGPNDKVLSCLGRHMPFYDRTIDVVVLSHPQADHLTGLISVIERFNVKYFIIGAVGNQTEGYEKLVSALKKKNIPFKNLYTGDQFSLGKVKLSVLWPEKTWVAGNLIPSPGYLSDLVYLSNPGDLPAQAGLASSSVLGLSTTRRNLNDFSFFLHLSFGSFDALFTGDADSQIQPEIMEAVGLPDVEVLKFPHHGSKYGVLPQFLEKVKPELAVISVGKNSYGHPTKEALSLLSERGIKVKRTDREGDIEIVSDGKSWQN